MDEEKEELKLREKLSEVAGKYNLDPTRLEKIVYWKNRGLTNREIATKLNVHPNTVTNYWRGFQSMEKDDSLETLFIILCLVRGVEKLKWIRD